MHREQVGVALPDVGLALVGQFYVCIEVGTADALQLEFPGDAFEQAGHEDAGAFLGLLAYAAVACCQLDEGFAGFGDLHDGLEELDLAA